MALVLRGNTNTCVYEYITYIIYNRTAGPTPEGFLGWGPWARHTGDVCSATSLFIWSIKLQEKKTKPAIKKCIF